MRNLTPSREGATSVPYSIGGELQGLPNRLDIELRKVADDLGRSLSLGDHRHDRRHRDTGTDDARCPTHDPMINGDSVELHVVQARPLRLRVNISFVRRWAQR